MQVTKCDRCGNECEPYDSVCHRMKVEEPFWVEVTVQSEKTVGEPDICESCFRDLVTIKEEVPA